MPYLPVDLDGKRKAHGIERALGLPRHAVAGGLNDLWEVVWRQKSAVVDDLALSEAFGPDGRIRDALVVRDFLEIMGEGRYRVRGADKWLFGLEGKKRGGQAAKGNLIPGPKPKGPAEEANAAKPTPSAPAEAKPDPSFGSPSALSPSTQQPNCLFLAGDVVAPPIDPVRAMNALGLPGIVEAATAGRRNEDRPTAPKGKRPKTEKPPPDPRHHPMKLRLMATYLEIRKEAYDFTGTSARALSDLLAKGTDDQIDGRWRRGLQGQFKERCDSLLDLRTKWNALTGTGPPVRAGGARFFAAQDANQSAFDKIGTVNDF